MKHDLEGRICVVTGGTGTVGAGAAAALLDAGATVVLPSRDPARADALAASLGARGGRVLTLTADLADEASALRLRDAVLARFGRLDHVVASIGGWWQGGAVVAQDLATWRSVMSTRLDAHFLTARALLPVLRPGSTYALVTGTMGELTVPGTALVSVAHSGLYALARHLRGEAPSRVRFDEVRLGVRIAREPAPGFLATRRLGDVFVAHAAGTILATEPIRITSGDDVAELVKPAARPLL